MIARLPMLCPDLEHITFGDLPRHPVITKAVSEMLLACNPDTLQRFLVDSPLTEAAREVVYRLPKLIGLWVVIRGRTLLPTVVLPNLTFIDVEYDDRLDWLQGFRRATLGKLKAVHFRTPQSKPIGDFLGEFETAALTTSVSNTLSTFQFHTSCSWNPNYRSLLPFTQLQDLLIEFSCDNGCSSTVDDNIIVDLARAMPKLQILRFGGNPCGAGGGVTVKGLIALARGCRLLSTLRIHFRTASLVEAATVVEVPSPSDDETVIRRQDCNLTDLEVGKIPIPDRSKWEVTVTLLQIFPHLLNIKFIEAKWREVKETIKLIKRIGTFVRRTGKSHLPYLWSPSVTFCQAMRLILGIHRNSAFYRFSSNAWYRVHIT